MSDQRLKVRILKEMFKGQCLRHCPVFLFGYTG